MYYIGQGFAKDDYQAAASYSKACESGLARGCELLGTLYEHGSGAFQNNGIAKRSYSKACDLGDSLGCDALKKLE
jgi:TPR repeat protein